MADYAHPNVLVDTQWLANHLNDDSLRIVEVDISPEPYQNAHIPGAVFWPILTDLLQPDLRLNLDETAFTSLLSRSGITPDTTVVAYGRDPGTGGWIFWLLTLFGHQNVRVLNGGYQKWMAEGRPVATELSTYAPTHYRAQPFNADLRVQRKAVQAAIGQPESVILDVRTPGEYRGELFLMQPPQGDERAGHIPGAVHLEHSLIVNQDGTFKSADKLEALFKRSGVTADRVVFPYCAIGGRSGFVWFVLTYLLGYPNVRNYDGSWNEWSRLPNTPVEV
ncbi:MAG: sulfurtransferase [Nodosilinea sp.]